MTFLSMERKKEENLGKGVSVEDDSEEEKKGEEMEEEGSLSLKRGSRSTKKFCT